jgi:YidC/Oxa1 family membrane protein insertase
MTFVLANIIQDVFSPLISVFESVLQFFHDQLGLSWGWSIVALTISVRTVLIPLTYRQLKSTLALQQHAPEMKKIQTRYKDDKAKQQEEMMKFYKENKVNPFGSCLPLLFQMPVFISLFYMLRTDLKVDICPGIKQWASATGHDLASTSCTQYGNSFTPHKTFESSFFFIPDITAKATGAVLVVLLVLYIGSQLASSWIMSVTADRNQRLLMLGLPFVFTIFILNFPAGLILYWITTNFWTVGQALVMRRMRSAHQAKLDEERAANGTLDVGGGVLAAGGLAAVSATDVKDPDAKPPIPRPFRREAKADATAEKEPEKKGTGKGGTSNGAKAGTPPPPPRRKKKRSGRRR